MSEEETPLAPDGQEGSVAEPTMDDIEASVVTDVTDSTAGQAEGQVEEFDWSQFKNADRFKGKSVQEVIDYLNNRDYQYGTQARELGDLRSYRQQAEARLRQITGGQPEAKPKAFTEGQKFEFAQKFQDDPLGAVSEFMGPQLADQLAQQVFQQVNEKIRPALQEQAQIVADRTEYAALTRNHPEIETDQKLRWMTHELMGPNYLGADVPFEQAMYLAKLAIDETSLFPETCYLMQRGVPFEKAKEYASFRQNAPANAESKKEQIKKEVAGLRRGAKGPTKSQRTSEPEIETMDDVAESVISEFS